MCGRYFFNLNSQDFPDPLWQKIVTFAQEHSAAAGEIFPSEKVVTIGLDNKKRTKLAITHWNFSGLKQGKKHINARSETVEEKLTFKEAFRHHRCIFPMNGFYEWDERKQRYLFTKAAEPLYVAGFYQVNEDAGEPVAESIIMTTTPNATVGRIHDRMPLLIPRQDLNKWLTDLDFARKLINQPMPELIVTPIEEGNKQEELF